MRLGMVAVVCGMLFAAVGCTSRPSQATPSPAPAQNAPPAIADASNSKPMTADSEEEPAAGDDDPGPQLGIGDAAPQLSVHTWLKGEPVAKFAPGSIYVVEFWATWCGPCVLAMPHLDELAKKHHDDSVVVVALTTADENNTQEAVADFVAKRGADYDFRFAFCEDRAMYDAYMKAARQSGIPCSFVVDQAGKIAYIGHPDYLEDVLAKVVAGEWDLEKARALTSAQQDFNEAIRLLEEKPERALAILEKIAHASPERAAEEDFQSMRILGLALAKRYDQLTALVEPRIATMTAERNAQDLIGLAYLLLASDQQSPHPQLSGLGTSALEKALEVGASDAETLLSAAQVYLVLGDQERALSLGQRAIEIAPEDAKELIGLQVDALKTITPDALQRAAEGTQPE